MAVLRIAESHAGGGGEQLAALGLLCGIVCSVLMLKVKGFRAIFNLHEASDEAVEAPAVASHGVYRQYKNERYANGSASVSSYKSIDPAMVVLPAQQMDAAAPSGAPGSSSGGASAPPPLPTTPPPLPVAPPPLPTDPLLVSPSPYDLQDIVSDDPKGKPADRVKLKDQTVTSQDANSKISKKERKERDKAEKERIKEQKKKDQIMIAEILKEDMERTIREVNLIKKRKQDEAKESKNKEKNIKNKPVPKTQAKEQSEPRQKAENPLAQANPSSSTDTLKSGFSTSSGPPPYSATDRHKAPPEVTLSESDSSGNTSFGKPVDSAEGTWDMVSQHRQQMRRPANAPVTTLKVDNSQYNVAGREANPSGVKVTPPRKSLYV